MHTAGGKNNPAGQVIDTGDKGFQFLSRIFIGDGLVHFDDRPFVFTKVQIIGSGEIWE